LWVRHHRERITVTVHIEGGDFPGIKALADRLASMNRSVLIGVPASAKAEADGTSMVLVAAVNEFGSSDGHIPERPFLRQGVKAGADKFERLNRVNLRLIVQGKKSVEESLEQLGVVAVGEVKRNFIKGEFKENAPATIERKGSSRPLINSGSLRQSITYVVEGSGKENFSNARVIE
jgi:hypothetical protein